MKSVCNPEKGVFTEFELAEHIRDTRGCITCKGMIVPISFDTDELARAVISLVDKEFQTEAELLLESLGPNGVISLCCAHWFSLSALVGFCMREVELFNGVTGENLASTILVEFCREAGLDYREVHNLMISMIRKWD